MHDASIRRNDAEVIEGLLAPAKELITFLIAFELDFHVASQRVEGAERIDLDRVVDDEIYWDQRIDFLWIATSDDFIPSRMAARSTTQGTPVKSCSTTRAGMKEFSTSAGLAASQSRDCAHPARLRHSHRSCAARLREGYD